MPSYNDVTLCMAYYENPGMLVRQLAQLDAMSALVRDHLGAIVVDDGSPRWPAEEAATGARAAFTLRHGFKLFRMAVDIPWNQDACRNIAAKESDTKWLLITDIDHMVPEPTWQRIIAGRLSWKTVYKFGRVSEPGFTPYKQHPNTWLLTREMYDAAGGYDERFAGWYGTDGDFRNRIQSLARIETLPDVVIRVPREVTPDASTTTIERRTPETLPNLDRIKREREKKVGWSPLRDSFPYSRVL